LAEHGAAADRFRVYLGGYLPGRAKLDRRTVKAYLEKRAALCKTG
jgi:hypothetical protein